jgi:DNA-binding GntR family transcriptional regulator
MTVELYAAKTICDTVSKPLVQASSIGLCSYMPSDGSFSMTTSSRIMKSRIKANAPRRTEHGNSLRMAFQQIRDMIVHGKLSPGTWIVEAEIAEHLNMSRTPVRGAIQGLQREGFIIEHKGVSKSRMVVAPLTSEDSEELYSIIGCVEGLAGRQIALMKKTERLNLCSILRSTNDQLRRIKKNGISHGAEIFDIDSSFHNSIIASGAGPRLQSLHRAVEPQTERYWRLYASSILDNLEFSIDEHDKVIRSTAEGDPDAVEQALRLNWANGYKRLAKLIQQFGERGSW